MKKTKKHNKIKKTKQKLKKNSKTNTLFVFILSETKRGGVLHVYVLWGCTFMIDLLLGFPWYHVVGTISYFQMKFYKNVVDDATDDKFKFVLWYKIVLTYSIGSSGFGCYVQDFSLCYDWQHRLWWACSYYTLSFDNVWFHEVV